MKFYLVWTSYKGGKDLYTVTEEQTLAEETRDTLNQWYKDANQKGRAYITYCYDGEVYYHIIVK